MCVLIVILMLNHFQCDTLMYDKYFSKGHIVRTTSVLPFPAL